DPRAHACPDVVGLMALTVTAAISTAASATEAAAGALFSGTSFVDGEVAAVEVRPVHGLNRLLRLFRRAHRDESKAAGTAGGAVRHEVGLGDHAMRREGVLQVVFCRVKRKVAHE